MNENINFDHKSHYDSILKTKDEMGKVIAAEFLNYLSDLTLKYSDSINDRIKNLEGASK
ncbi:hypothetical protein GMD78_07240 [Ornithinibacillus sp. L9]|uniref:Uncharacterized protein n=1 Tax=Ornithinibacillus caprae TaxID=2678566 RepID=A0A6N8FHL6_9BACI|nr:hypothetical protein [Ornithinibacillus caprae]MUK88186.1 hypothetical protein [Ornithinibacillus caprae]